MANDTKFLVKIETLQPSYFKSLFGILKDNNIAEANIIINNDGIEILEMDPLHFIVIHVLLNASNFESFYCQEPMKIGVDTVNLTKILKSVGSKDMLTLFVEDPEHSQTGEEGDLSRSIGLLIDNSSKGQSSKIYVGTLDVNDHDVSVPELNYPYHVQLPSSDLQSIVASSKNMNGEVIKLVYRKETLTFYTEGELGKLETIRTKTSKEDMSIRVGKRESVEGDDTSIIEIYVKLDKLFEFTKCSSLSQTATIHLKNDYPLIIEYDVGNLGFIRLGLSPHNKPDNW